MREFRHKLRRVPIRWDVPEHTTALERLETALTDGRGCVVLGPDGVGKSTLARMAAENLCRRHPATVTRWVTGTPTERAIPFGAFSHLVEITDVGKPAALLRAARASLGSGQPNDLLLIVDDAHELDILSATLVYQLAAYQLALAGTARMIVTARADAAPDAIAALWTDGLLDRVDVDQPEGTTDPAETSGAKATTGRSEPAKVDAFIAGLPAPARSVLHYLAVAEPLSLVDLTSLAGDGALAR